MQPDPLSAFLRSDAWFAHSGGRRDDAGNTFTKHALPGGGHYWRATRCFLPAGWKIPEFARDGWFVRLQSDSDESFNTLISLPHPSNVADSVQPRETMVLDLTASEDDLQAGFHPKHRYNIKLAEKRGVTVETVRQNVSEALPRFLTLLGQTAGRHGIRTHAAEHYSSIIKHLEPAGMVRLAFARHDDRDIAGILVITCNDIATYLHGGSSYDDRALMGPHLLHWETIKALKSERYARYDFWGVHTQNGQAIENHPSYGTTRFKLGFGGELVRYPATRDVVLNRFCYTLYKTAHRLQSRKRAFS